MSFRQQQFEIVAEGQAQVLEALAIQVEEAFQGQCMNRINWPAGCVLPEAHGIAQEAARVDVELDRFGIVGPWVNRQGSRYARCGHLLIPIQ